MRNRFLRGLIPALVLVALPALSSAGIFLGVSVNLAPPALPVYVQPPCPQPGYLWTPGYWGWNDGAYYWVPGTWVLPPQPGLLWTPGYWGWSGGVYLWHAGYWGPHVGFYGGVNYGFGYDGVGFVGGYWRGGLFFYNRAVERVGPNFARNVYYHPVVYRRTYEHVSFNGGPGGVMARPSRADLMAEHERHVAFTPMQQRQQRMAFADRSLRADYNHGRPPIAATARAAAFHGRGAFAARAAGGPVHYAPAHRATPMRSRGAAMHGQPGFARPQQQQRRFESRPQASFRQRGARPMERPQARPQARSQPQYRQNRRPQGRAQAPRRPPPRQQQRRGGERGQRPPPENRGGHGR